MKKSDLNGLKLTFEECRCGCDGHLAFASKFPPFWIFTVRGVDFKPTASMLYRGHGTTSLGAVKVGEYKTFTQAVNKANDVMRAEVRKMLEELGG